MDIVSKSYEGNLYTNFDICFKNMMGDGQTADNGRGDSIYDGEGGGHGHAQEHGAQGAGVHACANYDSSFAATLGLMARLSSNYNKCGN